MRIRSNRMHREGEEKGKEVVYLNAAVPLIPILRVHFFMCVCHTVLGTAPGQVWINF